MRAHASLRLGNVRGTSPKLLGSHRCSVCPLSVAPRVTFGALVWLGKRDSATRPPLLPLNAGTAEPFRVSPPEAVAYQLEVTAGFPSPAEEELADTMTLDEYLITNKEATYILKVNGESMIDAGILPGDLLLVKRGIDPRDGDIVIAQVDREWTMLTGCEF